MSSTSAAQIHYCMCSLLAKKMLLQKPQNALTEACVWAWLSIGYRYSQFEFHKVCLAGCLAPGWLAGHTTFDDMEFGKHNWLRAVSGHQVVLLRFSTENTSIAPNGHFTEFRFPRSNHPKYGIHHDSFQLIHATDECMRYSVVTAVKGPAWACPSTWRHEVPDSLCNVSKALTSRVPEFVTWIWMWKWMTSPLLLPCLSE